MYSPSPGPRPLMGEFERMFLFRLVLEKPGIYLYTIQEEIFKVVVADLTIINMVTVTDIVKAKPSVWYCREQGGV